MNEPTTAPNSATKGGLARFVPLALFAGFAVIGVVGLFVLGDRHELPSALLNKSFPEFSAPLLMDESSVMSREDLIGEPLLVNVWATWCPTCKAEHAELLRITQDYGVPIVGLNYKDDPRAARAFLARYGNPFRYNLVDADGQIGVDLGVYGAPETFLLDANGTIVYKRVGDVNPRIWRDELAPALKALGVELQANTGAG
ncbi:MAG: DsbE family thiol:disulfide interchange protein [Pseudomonadaceae bacterium]|nr:DsbE family thiol:disulfide interchange protein [Pseudomonadaceae bacterium]